MHKRKLCIGLNPSFNPDIAEQIRIIKKTGFEAIFTAFETEDMDICLRTAKEEQLEIQSIHAPFGGCADMWEGSTEEAEAFTNKLIKCVDFCSDNEIPIMVSHTYIGFDKHPEPSKRGLDYYGRVIEEAKTKGVRIAFENTEGEEFLDCIMKNFGDYENVGFCWDTGHEMCYNYSADMPGRYINRLFSTHLNDNLGIKDYNGKITWHDDLHLLPFDGIADWQNIVHRLKRSGFDGHLTFELLNKSKPERHENDIYANMPFEVFITEAYKRACRVAALFDNDEKE